MFGGDLSALSLAGQPAWEDFYPLGRAGSSLTYDPERCRLVMYGGYRGSYLGDVWTLSMGPQPTWTKLAVAYGPAPRYLHTATYDPDRKQMIVFGGAGYLDLWALGLEGSAAWTRIPAEGLAPDGSNKAGVYVPDRKQIWYFGTSPDDVWYLDLEGAPSWHVVETIGSAPGPGSVFYESARHRIIACGDGVYALSIGSTPEWSVLVPPGYNWSRSIYDAEHNRVIAYREPMRVLHLDDETWSGVTASGPPLPLKSFPVAVDAQNHRAVFYGAEDNSVRTLSWAPAGEESSATRAEISNAGVALGDTATLSSPVALTARVPGITCLDLPACVVRLDGADVTPPSIEPQGTIAFDLPSLADGVHRVSIRLASYGVRRVIGTATLDFRVIPSLPVPEQLWVGNVQATPNPARGSVQLGFRLGKPADWSIDLYDLTGRRVAHLAGGRGTAGANVFQWDGTMDGRLVGSGFYLYRVTATDGSGMVSTNGRVLFLR